MEESIEFFIEFVSDNITDKELKDIATIIEIINPFKYHNFKANESLCFKCFI